MKSVLLFTDGSASTTLKFGYGAYILVEDLGCSEEELKTGLKVKRFHPTSSTKLELQTLLWALSKVKLADKKVVIFTDSQNIVGLPGRRARLENSNYTSKRNKPITNSELYKAFYQFMDKIDFKIIKVQGHRASNQKDIIDRIFTLVDRASRNALRKASKG